MEVPSFSHDTLTRLTQNIKTNLKSPTIGKQSSVVKARGRESGKTSHSDRLRSTAGKEEQQGRTKRLRDGQIKTSSKRAKEGSLKERSKGKPFGLDDVASNQQQGFTDGDSRHTSADSRSVVYNTKVLKLQEGRNNALDSLPAGQSLRKMSKRRKEPADPTSEDRNFLGSNLKDEVFALGGTQEDLDLIENADSASDVEGPKSSAIDTRLVRDLQRLAQDLGVARLADNVTLLDKNELKKPESSNPNHTVLISRRLSPPDTGAKPEGKRKKIDSVEFEARAEWHTAELPALPSAATALPVDTVGRIYEYARELLEKENIEYGSRNSTISSAHQFYSTIMSAGTLSDKISALTLSVQESPVHNMQALESLVTLAKKRSRGQAVEVLGALKDLLGPGSLLPSNRKLRAFAAQPGLLGAFMKPHQNWAAGTPLPKPLQKIHLISWAFEDWLKTIYFEVLKILEGWSNDEIAFARGKSVEYIYELLRDKPEQEANLLRLLVNKLGDSDKKIASKASHSIIELETSHPLMKPTIINSIESDLLFRPGQSMHAKYYAIITLNQTVLSTKEEGVAKKLLDIYFSLFVNLLAKKEPAKHTLPVTNAVTFNRKGERQGGGSTPGKRAQKKSVSESKGITIDEELREKMLSAVLTGVNRAIPYINADEEFFDKHMDTLFRVTHSSNFNTSIQALMLIQQLCGSHQSASDRFYRTLYESLLDPRVLTSSKQALYLNLIFKALRSDVKLKRVEAFAKRLLQVTAMHNPPFACAVIYLLRELEGVFPNLQASLDQPEEDQSEAEEGFRDVADGRQIDQPERATAIQNIAKQKSQLYNGRKREPEYSNAERSCLWEIDPFLLHYHPSVALFASKLLTHEVMPAKPDLSMHTLIHFLDRFVYRNPKKAADGPRGASIMQPLAGSDTSGLLISAQGKSRLKQPVNTDTFWKMDGGKVDADEVFFHKYFNAMGKGKESAKKNNAEKKPGASNDSDIDEKEDEIWAALVNSRPEIEGSVESDDAIEMDDLESALESGDETISEEEILAASGGSNDDDGDAEGVIDFEDNEALLGSEEEVPSDLDRAFHSEVQFATDRDAAPENEKRRAKKRRLKNLPTFASADDYAAMLGEDEEDV